MPLGTLDRTPPPFFKQGPSALTQLTVFSALAVFLMVADTRFSMTHWLRAGVAAALNPVQRTLMAPVRALDSADAYFDGLAEARKAETRAQRELARQAERSMRVGELERENAQLRALLDLRARLTVASQAAEVLYDAPDPFTRKVVIDRGSARGILLGSPVIDHVGVIGQVTRVYPLSSEVTLLNDKDAAIPVLNARTQQRGAAYGHPNDGGMELRFMAGNADVQAGDLLYTSGLDGVYPPGLPVAKVLRVDRRADSAFAKIVLTPVAQPDSAKHVLVLQPLASLLPPRETAAANAASAPAVALPPSAASAARPGTAGASHPGAPAGLHAAHPASAATPASGASR